MRKSNNMPPRQDFGAAIWLGLATVLTVACMIMFVLATLVMLIVA